MFKPEFELQLNEKFELSRLKMENFNKLIHLH